MNNYSSKMTLIAVAFVMTSGVAHSGGLFGDGGLIRGSVGEFLDKHVEKPVTTPIAKKAREAAVGAAGVTCAGAASASGAGVAVSGLAGAGCAVGADAILPR